MKFKHTYTFWTKRFSLRERRLCFEDGRLPEYGQDAMTGSAPEASPTEIRRGHEQQRLYWADIQEKLNLAVAQRGSTVLNELWNSDSPNNRELRDWIMAQVKKNPVDGRTTYLPPNAQAHAREHERTYEKEQERLQRINAAVSDRVDDLLQVLEDGIEAIAQADREAGKAGDTLPVDAADLIDYLQNIPSREKLQARQHALVAIARDIVNAKDAAQLKAQLVATRDRNKDALGDELYEAVMNNLINKYLDPPEPRHFEQKRYKMLEELQSMGQIDLADREKIVAAINTLTDAIAKAEEEKDGIVDGALADQTRYLRDLAGDDRPALIRSGIRSENLTYSPDMLIANVRILKQDLTGAQEAELRRLVNPASAKLSEDKIRAAIAVFAVNEPLIAEIRKNFGAAPADPSAAVATFATAALREVLQNGKAAVFAKYSTIFEKIKAATNIDADTALEQLISAWDTDAIDRYLERDLNLDNEVGFSIKALMLRAKMPEDTARFLIDSDAKIRVSDLTKISAIETLVGSPVRFGDGQRRTMIDLVMRSEKIKQPKPRVAAQVRTLTLAFKASNNRADRVKLEEYVAEGLQYFPMIRRDLTAYIRSKTGAEIEVDVVQRGVHSLLIGADRVQFENLSATYKAAVAAGAADKPEKKKALVDFLSEKLEHFTETRDAALRLVTDTFGDAEIESLTELTVRYPTFVDPAKAADVEKAIDAYQRAIRTPDEAATRDELEKQLRVYLEGDKLAAALELFNAERVLTKEAATELYEMLVETNGAGQESINKQRFIETMTFLFVPPLRGSTAKDARGVGEIRAEEIWNRMISRGAILDHGFVPDRDAVITIMQTQRVGETTVSMHKQMHEQKLYELTWADNSKRYFGEFVDFATEGAGSWWEYMKDLGTLFVSDADPMIEKKQKQLARLRSIRQALQNAIDASDESEQILKKAIEDIEKLRDEQKAVTADVESVPDSDIDQGIAQALLLLEANAHVIDILRSENYWDQIPNPIRQVSLWIAMNKGNGSAERGLLEAKKFLRAYHHAPNARQHYENALGKFSEPGGATPEQIRQLKDTISTYQVVSKVDTKLAGDFVRAIDALAASSTIAKPQDMIGKTVTGVDSTGTEFTGVVASINTQNTFPGNPNAFEVRFEEDADPNVAYDEKIVYVDFAKYQKDQAAKLEQTQKAFVVAAAAFKQAVDQYEANKDPRNPDADAQEAFLLAYINGRVPHLEVLTPDQKTDLLRYRRKIETVAEIEGRNNLDLLFHQHGLFVKPAALMALAESRRRPDVPGVELPDVSLMNGSHSVDKWLATGHRDLSLEPLQLIIGGPAAAKDALIRAYIEKKDVQYEGTDDTGAPIMKVVTAEQAFAHVTEIRRRLQWQSEQQHPALEILDEDELFKNPVEGAYRGMLETLQDMWNGDMVDKAQVVAAVVGAFFLIRHIWQEGGKDDASGIMKLARYAMIGLPLLTVANTAYKNKTGRDIMGEKLLYMSPARRNNILEQWRRRSAKYSPERYGVLTHPAGFAAMQELMRKEDPVSIKDLHHWRMNVKDDGTGYNNYLHEKPANLDLSEIQWRLGDNATEEEAAKVAFMAYEALCVDVAAMHGKSSGDLRGRADWASDYIFNQYHLGKSYAGVPVGPDQEGSLAQSLQGRKASMLDVMIAEAQLPSFKNNVTADLTTAEQLANFMGRSVEWVQTKIIQGYTFGQIQAMKFTQKAPELWDSAKELAFSTKDDVVAWLNVRKEFAGKILADNFWETYRALKNAGIAIAEVAPGVFKFVLNGVVDITSASLKAVKDAHDYVVKLPPEMNYVQSFEEFVLKTFGFDVISELSNEEAKRQIGVEAIADASFWNGGNYPIRDVLQRVSKSTASRLSRHEKLLVRTAAGKALTQAEVRDKMNTQIRALSNTIYGIAIAADDNPEEVLTPAQHRFLLEVMRANMIKLVGENPAMQRTVATYNQEIADLETRISSLHSLVRNAVNAHVTAKSDLDAARSDYHLAWEAPFVTVQAEYQTEYAKMESLDQQLTAALRDKKKYSDEKQQKVNAKTLGALDKGRLDYLINSAQSKADNLIQQIDDTDTRLKDLVARMRLAQLPPDKRNPSDANGAITFTDADARLVLLPHYHSATNIATVKTRLDAALTRAINGHTAFKGLETNEKTLRKNMEEAHRNLTSAEEALNIKKVDGVEPVTIDADALFDPANISAERLNAPKADRKKSLFAQVFSESYNIVEIVPLGWLFGSAREKAKQVISAWKNRRMDNDKTLAAYEEQGKDPEAVSAYERYLEQVALNELFHRAMMQSPDGGEKEAQSPLHLSVSEARNIDEFLKERERLVSFAQFLEVWEAVPEANRQNYLP